jgi:hypothetical protein
MVQIKEGKYRVVGNRIEHPITFNASSELFQQGVIFNEEMNKMTGGRHIGIPRGVIYFKNKEQKNIYDLECTIEHISKIALEDKSGKE